VFRLPTNKMGNSISLNLLADDAHLTVNSHRHPRNGDSQLGSPLSPRSDISSELSGAFSASTSSSSLEEGSSELTTNTDPASPKMRQCWICYGEEEISISSEFVTRWVAPCNCKGTTKWVHQACLLDWIDSQVINNATLVANRNSPVINQVNQVGRNNSMASPFTTPLLNVNSPSASALNPAPRFQTGDGGPLVLESVNLTCPQCHAPYKISEAHALPRRVLLFIDYLARLKERTLMWSTLGLVSSSIYTVAFSYGFFTGWMVGGREYLEFIRDSFDPTTGSFINRLQLSIGIPLTPLFALSSSFSMFSWTYPLVPLFLFDGHHRISLTQPRGILLFMPLIWSTHRIVIDGLIPMIFRRLSKRNHSTPTISGSNDSVALAENSEISISAIIDEEEDSISSSEYSSTDSGTSTVKISILSTTAALLFPTAAALTGWVMASILPKTFAHISPFHRSLIGAGVLTIFKDFSKLLYWYQTVRLRKYRRVLNRTE
jgi:hypothetical protein